MYDHVFFITIYMCMHLIQKLTFFILDKTIKWIIFILNKIIKWIIFIQVGINNIINNIFILDRTINGQYSFWIQ